MALEGNLTDFGLSEILQLIAVQQKSGMLSVSSQDRSMMLFFKNGNIISTRDRRKQSKDPFKDYLTRYGVLSREELIRITQISAQSKLDLTDIIVSEGILSEEEMRKHYRGQITEAVHEILTWQQCNYKFIPGADIIESIKSWGEYGIEGMLMESMRRIDEFPQMLKEFPDQRAKISRSGGKGSKRDLSANEKSILDLLGEERTLSYLISHAKMPLFEVYEALHHLKEKGAVKISLEKAEEEEKSEGARAYQRIGSRRSRGRFMPVTIAIVLFLSALLVGIGESSKYSRPQSSTLTKNLLGHPLVRERIEEKIRWLLEAHAALYGSYPRSISGLSEKGLAPKGFMRKVSRFSFRYHLTPGGYTYTLL